jgi:hypothetical protein
MSNTILKCGNFVYEISSASAQSFLHAFPDVFLDNRITAGIVSIHQTSGKWTVADALMFALDATSLGYGFKSVIIISIGPIQAKGTHTYLILYPYRMNHSRSQLPLLSAPTAVRQSYSPLLLCGIYTRSIYTRLDNAKMGEGISRAPHSMIASLFGGYYNRPMDDII